MKEQALLDGIKRTRNLLSSDDMFGAWGVLTMALCDYEAGGGYAGLLDKARVASEMAYKSKRPGSAGAYSILDDAIKAAERPALYQGEMMTTPTAFLPREARLQSALYRSALDSLMALMRQDREVVNVEPMPADKHASLAAWRIARERSINTTVEVPAELLYDMIIRYLELAP